MDELKPCPFCGDLLEIVRKNGSKYVRCISGVCIFETARHGHHISDDELIKRCNRRPAEDALKAENKKLCSTISGMEKTIGRAEKVLGERNLLAAEVKRLSELNSEMEKILRRQCSLCQLRDHEVRCEWCDIEKILNKIKKEENKQ